MPVRRRDQEAYNRFEQFMEVPMLLLSIVFLVIILVPVFTDLPEAVELGLDVLSVLIWAVFVFEYVGLLYLAPDRWTMIKSHWLDLIIIVVPMLRPLRASRAFRLVRVFALAGRGLEATKRINRRPGFSGFLAFVLVVLVLGGLAVFSFEHSLPESPIDTVGDGLWWAVVTVTTVGYGDVYPVTPEGRAVAVLLMFVGIALLSVVTANIAAYFVSRDEGGELSEIRERLTRLEEVLIADEIQKLSRLHADGLLAADEFAVQRDRLLGRTAAVP